jgi:hypothetical protein
MSDQIFDKIEELRAEIEKLSACARSSHYYCDDSWYSCPKAEDGCANEEAGEDCRCGADEINAEVAAIKAGLDSKMDELISVVMQTPI